jgi:hypothetical protein
VGAPFNLAHRTGPGLSCKYRPISFGKFAVKGRVVGDNDRGVGSKSGDGIAIDFVAGGHFVGDAVQLDGFFGNRFDRLVERANQKLVAKIERKLLIGAIVLEGPSNQMEIEVVKKAKKKIVRREYTKGDVKELRAHSKTKTPVAKIMELTKRTEGSLRQKALKLGISLGHRR